jgi:Na+-transporting NADH:ubiquinone oxidoreductase subunit NqrB
MIIFLSILILINVYQDVFTLRVTETILISVITAIVIDGLIIRKKTGVIKFPSGAFISGLIIAALIEPELENRFIYLVPPTVAIVSKHLIRISNRNVFNPAALGLLATLPFYPAGLVTWWACTPVYLFVPFGLFIVYKMRGWNLVVSFFVVSAPLYIIFGELNNIGLIDSLVLINLFFALFMLTEHKAAPMIKSARIAYGCFIGVLSFLFHVFLPEIENSITALIIGNACAPLISKFVKKGKTR